ncbi:DctP family TRAP transporter solute-binding subunit [Paenibacillus aestuarii]|uniref:DctP family TRAP transporter solute-binding subunit n=1 Tax=Paenibacillus aestuarii TaxID=516965 RepID=A0ABW0KHM1_9BACL|nr:DctP family TRAP transporter solute-binding subunit [Paenibacillus aestuarii]
MKTFAGIALFVILGLVTAVVFGFSSQFNSGQRVYDDEQQGLGEQTVIRFSFVVAENTPKGRAAQEFARLVKLKTNDTVRVELFPNGTLYNENDEVAALQRGSIQIIAPSFSNISEVVPEWMAMDLPFAFRNDEAVKEAFQGKIGSILMGKLESHGMIGLGLWANGFQQMTSNVRPLVHLEDFRNLKFRILPSKIIEAQFRLLNAGTSPIPFNKVYRSMESGEVDSGENTISNIYSRKLYQVQKYLTISNHAYLGYGVIMNKQFWDKLSLANQQAITAAMQEATVWANQDAISFNNKQLDDLKKTGQMDIHILTDDERQAWQQALEPVYTEARAYIGQELLDAVNELRQHNK